jgi:hypothetical protein
VTSQDTGKLGWVILLAMMISLEMMISVVDDRLVIGRLGHIIDRDPNPRHRRTPTLQLPCIICSLYGHTEGRWLTCPRLASWNSLPQRTRAGKHKYSELSMSLNAIAVNADAGADPPVTGHRNWVVAMVNSNGPDSRPALP